MAPVKLSSAAHIEGLNETPILPEQPFETHQNYLPFPVATPDCKPKPWPAGQQNIPRFSLFSAADVNLDGFRLYRHSGHFFTDLSLVAPNLEREEAFFNWKLANRQIEDLKLDRLGNDGPDRLKIVRDGPILLACSDEPANFGSWIYRFMPKLMMSAASGIEFESIMVYHTGWITDLIRFLGFDGDLIPHNPVRQYHILQPLIPSLPVPYVYFRPEVRQCLQSIHDRQDETATLGDKIYISRRAQALKNPKWRALENETGLVAALLDLGFKEFIPERYSFAEQVAIFDKARLIIGCGGSNMFGCIFARHAELIIDIESGDEWSYAHANLLASTSGLWSMVKGTQLARGSPPHRNWTIDIAAVTTGYLDLLDFL
jgi:capsular polysaccharide biosynthesis protein